MAPMPGTAQPVAVIMLGLQSSNKMLLAAVPLVIAVGGQQPKKG